MKFTRMFWYVAVLFVFTSLSLAESPKPFSLTPVPNPGKEAKHASFNEISKKGEASLVFLGDSITDRWTSKGKAIWDQYWLPLGAANFGIGGDRTEHILWRLQNGNFDGLKPKLTVLMIGTNNTGKQGFPMAEHGGAAYSSTAEETAAGITEIVKLLKEKQPDMKVLLLGIFPRGATPDDKMRQQNEKTNELIAKLDDGKTVFFMDISESLLESDGTVSKEIMPDYLHLSEKGYEVWAKAILPRVKELMGN